MLQQVKQEDDNNKALNNKKNIKGRQPQTEKQHQWKIKGNSKFIISRSEK